MNNDLISREALKKAIEQYQIQWNKNCEIDIAKWDCCENILAIIDHAPTVGPRIEYGTDGQPYKLSISNGKEFERPQGEWKEHYGSYICSECGQIIGEYKKNYCATCGAKMQKGD